MRPKGTATASPAERAAKHPKSKSLAIAAYCYHACQAETSPNCWATKAAVRDCPNTACPLWPHRGWQTISRRTAPAR